jgi:hypothetical protein
MWWNAIMLMRNEATAWFNTMTPWAVEIHSLFLRWRLLCHARLADCKYSQTFRLPFGAFSLRAIDSLTFESLAITLCTSKFDIQKFYMVLTLRLQGCWYVLSPTRKETSWSDRRFWLSYILFIIIIGGILVLYIYIYIYNKTSIKTNILTIKQNTSGSRSG